MHQCSDPRALEIMKPASSFPAGPVGGTQAGNSSQNNSQEGASVNDAALSPKSRTRQRRRQQVAAEVDSAGPPLRLFSDTSNLLRHAEVCVPASSRATQPLTVETGVTAALTTPSGPSTRTNAPNNIRPGVPMSSSSSSSSTSLHNRAKRTCHRDGHAPGQLDLKLAECQGDGAGEAPQLQIIPPPDASMPHSASTSTSIITAATTTTLSSFRTHTPSTTTTAAAVEFSKASSSTNTQVVGAAPQPVAAANAPAATASRVLFLHEADESTSHDDGQFTTQTDSRNARGDGVSQSGVVSNKGNRSSRSPSDVLSGATLPRGTRREPYLLDLLTCASSTEFADVAAVRDGETVDGNTASSTHVWLRTPSSHAPRGRGSGSVSATPVMAAVGVRSGGNLPDLTARCAFGELESGGRCAAARRLSRTPSPTRRAARSGHDDAPYRLRGDHDHDNRSSHHPHTPELRDLGNVEEDGAESSAQEHHQQQLQHPPTHPSSSHVPSSPSEVLRFSFPSLTLNLSAADASASGRPSYTREASRGTSPSVPRNLFSDAHDCAAELPELDMLSIAAATAADFHRHNLGVMEERASATSSSPPTGGLDMSSFRTPISPCPSSVAPPFSVFSCAATSRVTSPVSIPAKMMKQRQQEHAWVRSGSVSPATQRPASSPQTARRTTSGSVGGGPPPPFPGSGGGGLCASLQAFRESFGSLTATSATVDSLRSAVVFAARSASREVGSNDVLLDRGDAPLSDVKYNEGGCSTSQRYGGVKVTSFDNDSGEEGPAEAEVDEEEKRLGYRLCRSSTSASRHHADPAVEDIAGQCHFLQHGSATTAATVTRIPAVVASMTTDVTMVSAATTATTTGPSLLARHVGGVSLRMRFPMSGTCTPPLLSPRSTSCEASLAHLFPMADQRPEGSSSSCSSCRWLHASPAPSEASVPTTATTRQSCCASPWSPSSARNVHFTIHGSSPKSRVLSHDGRLVPGYHRPALAETEEKCRSAVYEYPEGEDVQHAQDTALTLARGNERSFCDVSGFSTRCEPTLQLVPPPPLVELPRSLSTATSTSSPYSAMASPAWRLSRHGSPLVASEQENSGSSSTSAAAAAAAPQSPQRHFVETQRQGQQQQQRTQSEEWSAQACHDSPHRTYNRNDREDDDTNNAEDDVVVRAAVPPAEVAEETKLAASEFHYAFSSLRGSRSRQEDSVTLIPELLVREVAKQHVKMTGVASGAVIKSSWGDQMNAEETGMSDVLKSGEELYRGCVTPTAQDGGVATFTCFGVFDGHCGDVVSSLASQYFPEHFEFAVQEYWAQWSAEKARRSASEPSERHRQGAMLSGLSASACTSLKEKEPNSTGEGDAISVRQDDSSQRESEVPAATTASAEFQRVISAALVQSLVHLDLTLYDALHQKTSGRVSAQRRDAGSTASVAVFFKVPRPYASLDAGAAHASFNPHAPREHAGEEEQQRATRAEKHSGAADAVSHARSTSADTYRLCIANLGDSRAVVGNKRTRQLLLATTDHRISACPTEEARIASVGGVVELGRVDGSLDVTRGLGDYRYKVDPAQWWACATTATATAAPASAVRRASGRMQSPVRALPSAAVSTRTAAAPTTAANKDAYIAIATTAETAPKLAVTHSGDNVATSLLQNIHSAFTVPTSDEVVDTPHAEVPSTVVRALRWHSGSTTPVRDSAEANYPGKETASTVKAAALTTSKRFLAEQDSEGEEDRGIENQLNVEAVAAEEQQGRRGANNTGESLVEKRVQDQSRKSMVNTTSCSSSTSWAAGLPASLVAPCGIENGPALDADDLPSPFLRHRTAVTATTAESPLFAAQAPSRDVPRASLSPPPPFTSAPASPLQPAAALRGNAVSNIADVYEWEVHRDDVLIIASDGVWDNMTSEEVLDFVCCELQALEADEETAARDSGCHTDGERRDAPECDTHDDGDAVGHRRDMRLSSRCFSQSSSLRCSVEQTGAAGAVSQRAGTPVRAASDDAPLQYTPVRQASTACHGKALCTPCGDGGGTPGGTAHGSDSRSSAVQTAARRLTEYVVNTLSGNDNTTAIVVLFQ